MKTFRLTFVRAILFTILLPGTLAIVIPAVLRRLWPIPVPLGVAKYAGVVFILFGLALYGVSALRFLVEGGGTPAIWFSRPMRWLIGEEPGMLVSGGPYRFTRNPMYLSGVCFIFGQGLLFESGVVLAYSAIVWLVFHTVVVFGEEPHLKAKYGRSYEEYLRRTPRWFGIRRRPP
jgi:protein-S-isoprenylcysteine O-methyltransferase Ste14